MVSASPLTVAGRSAAAFPGCSFAVVVVVAVAIAVAAAAVVVVKVGVVFREVGRAAAVDVRVAGGDCCCDSGCRVTSAPASSLTLLRRRLCPR